MSDRDFEGFLGESPEILRIKELILKVAPTKLPVLIQGPTGSGKELVAQAIHRLSGRTGRFVAFNVCAISETMFEDALFGHVRGAFTGASSSTNGLMMEADGGTIFLDEICSLSGSLQPKLLRTIETGEFRRVGASRDHHSDFRVVAAANVALQSNVSQGAFRADLMFRLSGVVINIPSLSQRSEDVPALADYFAARASDGVLKHISDGGLNVLCNYDWPGNVRELKATIARASAMTSKRSIGTQEIVDAIDLGGNWGQTHEDGADSEGSLDRKRLLKVCAEHDWDAARTATALGLGRTTLFRQLKSHGISLRAAARESKLVKVHSDQKHNNFTLR